MPRRVYPEDLQRAKFTEEKEQKEDPNELIKIIMGNSYLRRQLCSFYSLFENLSNLMRKKFSISWF